MTRVVLFAQGLRPFFLLAGIDAIFNMAVWLLVYFRPGLWPAAALPAMYWHGHEMIFGFIAAAIAGFLLTAVPGWTGRSSYAGAPLILLSALWFAGRVTMFAPVGVPPAVAAVIDLAFFPALAGTLTPPLVKARKVRNFPFPLLLVALFAADLVFHLGSLGKLDMGEHIGLGVAVDVISILIVIVGGRIIPAFTKSGLARFGFHSEFGSSGTLEYAAIASIIAVLVGDLTVPLSQLNGAVAVIAGVLQALRLAQWKGYRTVREPLIWVLHLGYAWLALGLLLKGIWLVADWPIAEKWLHALTVGAFATMILAVMTRASLGHTGRPLTAPPSMAIGYLLLTVAALVRVFAPALAPAQYGTEIEIAGACWLAAFGLFVIVYAPILTRPRADRRPG
jgi:uncharacterized protein involved in response to NO